MNLWKIVSTFYKDHPEKPTATLAPLDSASLMAKSTIQLPAKQKQEQSTGRAKKCAKWSDTEESARRNSSQYSSRVRSRPIVRDLSLWRRECRGACNGSLTIGSSTPEKLHNTLFWQCLLLSKFLIDQITSLLSLPIPVFPFLSLVQVRKFFHRRYLHL